MTVVIPSCDSLWPLHGHNCSWICNQGRVRVRVRKAISCFIVIIWLLFYICFITLISSFHLSVIIWLLFISIVYLIILFVSSLSNTFSSYFSVSCSPAWSVHYSLPSWHIPNAFCPFFLLFSCPLIFVVYLNLLLIAVYHLLGAFIYHIVY